jgi:hypothetical protein
MGPRHRSARLIASDSVTTCTTRRRRSHLGQMVRSTLNTLLSKYAHGCLPHAYRLACRSLSGLVSQSASCAGNCGSVGDGVSSSADTTWFRRLQFGVSRP